MATEKQALANQTIQFTAQSIGDLHGAFLQDLLGELRRLQGDERLLAQTLVARLNAGGLVKDSEAKLLGEVIEALTSRSDLACTVIEVEAHYRAIGSSEDPSPIALAVAGVALNSVSTAAAGDTAITVVKKEKEKKEKKKKGTAFNDLMGALAGAGIGSKGGLWGGILGGLVGGVGASYVASRDEDKKDEGNDKKKD